MSVVIRLSRAGRVHLPYYHIGVFNSRTRRDGRPVEDLGFYDPKSVKEPIRIDLERARYWLGVGAKPSRTVMTLLKTKGVASSEWAAKKPAKKKTSEKKPAPAAAKAGAKKKKPAAKKTASAAAPAKKRKARTATSKARGEKKAKA